MLYSWQNLSACFPYVQEELVRALEQVLMNPTSASQIVSMVL